MTLAIVANAALALIIATAVLTLLVSSIRRSRATQPLKVATSRQLRTPRAATSTSRPRAARTARSAAL